MTAGAWRRTILTRRLAIRRRLSAEVVERDLVRLYPDISQHVLYCRVHHRRTTHVELDLVDVRVVLQVVVVDDLVDEAGVAGPVVFGQGIREGDVVGEVRELLFDRLEIVTLSPGLSENT